MTGWGSDWNTGVPPVWPEPKQDEKVTLIYSGTDLASEPSITIYGVYTKDGFVNLTEKEFQNKFKNTQPTHDPYTNPNSHIYYECGCGAILDPGTNSFASLNNHASEAGWKVRWGADSYVPYCVKCGEGVE